MKDETNITQPIIRFHNVCKRFNFDQQQSLMDSFVSRFSPFRKQEPVSQELWAMRDLSFDILPGQCVGIIGRNGSGKSSLLKHVARVLYPTSGTIEVQGQVSALLELGAGFHPDLTGRENIFLNASLLGLSKKQADQYYQQIVDFSELAEFIEMPVKHYSSGMYMRLAFSVAIHVNSQILLVDEILAVGDQAFQNKCLERIYELKDSGVTIIVVSHDLEMLQRLCTHLLWIEHGVLQNFGPAVEVSAQYQEFTNNRQGIIQRRESAGFPRWGTQEIEITEVRLLNHKNEEAEQFYVGESLTLEIHYHAHHPIEEPEFGMAIHRQDGVHVTGTNTRIGQLKLGVIHGRGVVRHHIPKLNLLPSLYRISLVAQNIHSSVTYDFHNNAYPFHVVSQMVDGPQGVMIFPNTSWTLEKTAG